MRRSKIRDDARNGFRDDDGSTSLEFVTAGLVLLLPLVYLILTMSAIQGGALAVEGASRQATRVYVEASSTKQAAEQASAAIDVALADYGLDSSEATVIISCHPRPRHCLERRGFVTVTVQSTVTLPLVPPVLDLDVALAVPLRATATEQVSRFTEADQ